MRAAIVTAEYFKRHETMVNFHVERLFSGNTCVICSLEAEPDPMGRAVLVRRIKPPSTLDLLSLPFQFARNEMQHKTVRVPFGRERAKMLAFLRDEKVEVGISEFGTQTVAVAPIFEEAGVPLFGYFRGSDSSKAIQSEKRCEAYRRMMPKLAGVVSVAQYLLDKLAEQGISHPNSHVIPTGVDTSRFLPGKKIPKRFLSVGRFVDKKLPKLTLRAFAKGTEGHEDAVLEMVGGGPLLPECRALAEELGIARRVIFHDQQPHDVVCDRQKVAEVFLQHSVIAPDGNTEGLPTAIQEAMACGQAVISTRHAGIPEAVVEGETGLLVDEHDEAGFAAAIAEVLSGKHDIAAMGQRARQAALLGYDNRILVSRFERVIEETLAKL